MNPILIIREEIVCLVILVFILIYNRLYSINKDDGSFFRICIYAILHTLFDLVTVITVNKQDVIPDFVNFALHSIFYIFALLNACELLCYTVKRCFNAKTEKIVRIAGMSIIGAYFVSLFFLKMVYIEGKGTYYSYGPAAMIGYGIAMLFYISSMLIILCSYKKVDARIFYTLIPMLVIAILVEIIQIIIPEFLFTGGATTIITVGLFFSLENPIVVFRQKALYDALTGIKSRLSYQQELIILEKKHAEGEKFAVAMCDINNLKMINDTFGHHEGDIIIGLTAKILTQTLQHAIGIYRMGGDEFLAIYEGNNYEMMEKEIQAVEEKCANVNTEHDYKLSIAIGYTLSQKGLTIEDSIGVADKIMYNNKKKAKNTK